MATLPSQNILARSRSSTFLASPIIKVAMTANRTPQPGMRFKTLKNLLSVHAQQKYFLAFAILIILAQIGPQVTRPSVSKLSCHAAH